MELSKKLRPGIIFKSFPRCRSYQTSGYPPGPFFGIPLVVLIFKPLWLLILLPVNPGDLGVFLFIIVCLESTVVVLTTVSCSL